MSNLLKGYRIAIDEDRRVVEVDELLQRRIKEEEERLKNLSYENYSDDTQEEFTEGFVEGLNAQSLDAILNEDAESALIKKNNQDELERVNAQIEDAKLEIEEAKAQAEQIIQEAQAQAEEIKRKAYEEAHDTGYDEGRKEGRDEYEFLKQDLERRGEELRNDYEEKVQSLEPRFVDALTDIYEHIFKVNLESYRNVVSSLVIDAINGTDGAKNIIVHVCREDFNHVLAHKEEILAQTGMLDDNVDFIQDATLNEGGCMIETPNGMFDCSLETELSELKRKLMILAYSK